MYTIPMQIVISWDIWRLSIITEALELLFEQIRSFFYVLRLVHFENFLIKNGRLFLIITSDELDYHISFLKLNYFVCCEPWTLLNFINTMFRSFFN